MPSHRPKARRDVLGARDILASMNLRRWAVFAIAGVLFATEPNSATRRWWAHVTALSNDSLQGRDTGSEGYRKAAAYVVAQFERNGLKPAGEHGFYQTVPLHEVRFRADRSTVELAAPMDRKSWNGCARFPFRRGSERRNPSTRRLSSRGVAKLPKGLI